MSEGLARTRLNKSWLFKTAIFALVLLVFGVWGLSDALIIYPKRGEAVASYYLTDYLAAASKAGLIGDAAVADPVETLAELRGREQELRAKSTTGDTFTERQAAVDVAKLDWLGALAMIGQATPQRTSLEGISTTYLGARSADSVGQSDLVGTLAKLQSFWQRQSSRPAPLAVYDIPTQWVFVVVGGVGGFYMVFTLISAFRTTYRFESTTNMLTLPGGRTISPADLSEVDKRKWHKLYVTLVLKNGDVVTLDLLRYVPLEEWVLQMEAIAFPTKESEAKPEEGSGAGVAA